MHFYAVPALNGKRAAKEEMFNCFIYSHIAHDTKVILSCSNVSSGENSFGVNSVDQNQPEEERDSWDAIGFPDHLEDGVGLKHIIDVAIKYLCSIIFASFRFTGLYGVFIIRKCL
jgi:hypothetical protein